VSPGDPTKKILRAVEEALAPHSRAVLAVSGGVDSMVLLDAAARVGSNSYAVASFDHGTGAAATSAADLVRDRCRTLGVECTVARANRPLTTEADFRAARWEFLRATAASLGDDAAIVTAHTADDQVETVCLRVMRDAGARGLAGLYARTGVVRPLLDVWRNDIRQYAARRALVWVEDPTNTSPRHARNRVRHDLLPALRRVQPGIDTELLAIAREAARWRDDVDAYVRDTLRVRAVAHAPGLDVDAASIVGHSDAELAVIWPAMAARAGATLDRRGIARLVHFVATVRVGARIQLSGGWEVVRSRDAFQLRASNGADSPAQAIPATGGSWGDWNFRPIAAPGGDNWSATLPGEGPFTVRTWRPGDRMTARSGGPARPVKYFLSKAGVTGHERGRWPVVLTGDQIVWIPGVRRSDAATARSGRPGLPFVCEYQTS